ncbi:hypothetical protein FOXYSP1_06131 [Fusarium oxysporum f. sp. phaseoli]
MLPDVEEPIQIIMDRATSKTMDAFVVFVTMEDAMRCAETMLPDVEEPIHIIMDQATSKTMDMFEELVTMGDAMFCVEKLSYLLSTAHGVPHSHKLNERVHVLRHR